MTVVEHLQRLIGIPSVSVMSNRPVVEYATGVLNALGWTMREIVYIDAVGVEKVNLIAAPMGQDVAVRDVELAFVCHTDTVPFAANWSGAISARIENAMVHGCGACDVKGILACLLTAATRCEGKYVDGLRLVLTADEEIGCVGAKYLMESAAIKARRMVIGEPTSLHVARAGKGYCLARVRLTGREAHSAHPAQGASAIFAAARIIVALEALAERLKQERNAFFEPQYTTLNVGTIQGGKAKNIVPGACEFLVEWRPIRGAGAVLEAIYAIAGDVEQSGVGCEVEVLRQQAGFETRRDAPLVLAVEQMTGRDATSVPFGSEASIFAGVAEEIVVFGPGDMRTAHSDRECVPIDELDQAVNMMCGLMTGS